MHTIDRDELHDLLTREATVRVVSTPGPAAYEAAHIPGSETFASFDDALARLDPDDDIVVYCSHEACVSSFTAYHRLVRHGYTRVRRYAGGLSDLARRRAPTRRHRPTEPIPADRMTATLDARTRRTVPRPHRRQI